MSFYNLQEDTDKILLTQDLDLVAQGLTKITLNQPLSKKEKNCFRFWGKVFERTQNPKSNPELATLTTNLTPEFYSTISQQNNDYKRISKFLISPYGEVQLTKEELERVSGGFKLISTNITARLQAKYKMGQI